MSENEWMTISEAAKLRNTSRQALWGLVKRGAFVSRRVGHRLMVSRASVEAYDARRDTADELRARIRELRDLLAELEATE